MQANKELKLGIPKGSLEEMTIELFRKSGWKISTTSRSYFPSIDDDSIRCSMARPQEMSRYVEMGTLDVAITGKDWTLENSSDIHVVCEMVYSKTSFRIDHLADDMDVRTVFERPILPGNGHVQSSHFHIA